MNKQVPVVTSLILVSSLVLCAGIARAGSDDDSARPSSCRSLPSHAQLRAALVAAQSFAGGNGGFGFEMWGTVVNRDGIVCAVAFTGGNRGDQWPGSRVISAQKANTGNEFSLPHFALSSANLFSAVQPGGSLFGLQESNPVDTNVAYGGDAGNYGQSNDPMVGGRIGGVNVFGGGLGLYNAGGVLVGGIGVSGDTSCADHAIAYRTRNTLNLDYVPAGVGDAAHKDNIKYDIVVGDDGQEGKSASGFGHPHCLASDVDPLTLPPTK
jgi:heme-degrading protein